MVCGVAWDRLSHQPWCVVWYETDCPINRGVWCGTRQTVPSTVVCGVAWDALSHQPWCVVWYETDCPINRGVWCGMRRTVPSTVVCGVVWDRLSQWVCRVNALHSTVVHRFMSIIISTLRVQLRCFRSVHSYKISGNKWSAPIAGYFTEEPKITLLSSYLESGLLDARTVNDHPSYTVSTAVQSAVSFLSVCPVKDFLPT